MLRRQIRNRKQKSVLESRVVRLTKAAAKKAGYLHRKIKYDGRNGAPDDFFFGYEGDLIIIEFKKPGGVPEDHQGLELSRMRKRGFNVYVIDNEIDGVRLFEGRSQW